MAKYSAISQKQIILFLLKLLISGGLIAWVFISHIDLPEILHILAEANVWLLLLSFGMSFSGFLFSALRWQKLLQIQNVHVKLFPLIDSYVISSFFNFIMPTRIGGDVIRVSDLRQAANSISISASTVFVERLLGIAMLFCFAICAALVRFPLAQKIPTIWIGLSTGLFGLIICLAIFYFNGIDRLISLVPWPKVIKNLLSHWQNFKQNSKFLLSKPEAIKWGLKYSFLLQVLVVIHFWVIGEALNFPIPMIDYFFIVPVQLIVLMLPTINGIGVREVSSVILFGFYGVDAAAAVTYGFVDFAIMFFVALLGWGRFLFRRSIPAGGQQPLYSVHKP